ncbi:MAG: hypothetical protein GXO91_02840 [FCB group bacterium]|nr:hypothetical protein [FCB group bacterium]
MLFYIFYTFLSPVFAILLVVSALFNRKIRLHLWHQSATLARAAAVVRKNRNKKQVVIFHAASAGEFEQLKPILEALDRGKYLLVQTFFSPTIYQKASGSKLFDVCLYHPFDLPWSAARFFRLLKPDYYILTRHDIWPHHVHQAKKRGIKTVLINANLHLKSARLHPLLLSLNRWLFHHFDLITTGSQRLRENLSGLCSTEKVFVTGDTRFDQVIRRAEAQQDKLLSENFISKNNMIFGSIITSDHPLIFGALSVFYPDGSKTLIEREQRLILVPHEVDESTLLVIEAKLKELKFTPRRYSKLMKTTDTHVLLVDETGILPDLYRYASLAYIGAGFGAGVHSVLEPAVYGTVVSFGPNIHILDEAISMFELGIGRMVYTAEDLADFMHLLTDKEKQKELSEQTRKFVLDNSGVTSHLINLIFGASV